VLTKNEALELVRQRLPEGSAVLEDATVERSYGWLFFAQSKEYIETRDPAAMLFGSGGILVEKHTGRCVDFVSAFSTDINLWIYEAGYLDHPDYDLVVTEVSQIDEAVRLLTRLALTYVAPEISSGTTWRIPKVYTQRQMHAKLSRLPCRLNVGGLYFRWQVLEHMKSSAALKFSLVPTEGGRNEV
jgi:Immunity protein 35